MSGPEMACRHSPMVQEIFLNNVKGVRQSFGSVHGKVKQTCKLKYGYTGKEKVCYTLRRSKE